MLGRLGLRVLAAAALAVSLLMVTTGPAQSASFAGCVAPGGAGGCSATIQQAVYVVPDGGAIHVAPGTYAESVEVFGKSVTIVGDDAATTRVLGAAGRPTVVVYQNASATLSGLTLTHAAGVDGPGLYNDSPTTVFSNGAVSGNTVSGSGAGIVNWGRLTLGRSSVSGNSASDNGAGILNGGTLIVSETAIHANAAGVSGFGGGIYNTGALSVSRSTIDANTALGGAGLVSFGMLPTALETTTLADNRAASNGGGIAVGGGSLTLTSATVAGNAAPLGANVYTDGTTITASGTVVADAGERNCVGYSTVVVSGGHNLDSGSSCGLAGAGDLQGVDPRLQSLADNGGPTRTRAVPAGSPALDSAGSVCPPVDQRGVSRPRRAACDIGAFEAAEDPVVTIASPVDRAAFAVGQLVTARYRCADALSGASTPSCVGTVALDAPLDTSRVGTRTFSVTGVDAYGFVTTRSVTYTVATTMVMGPQAMEGDLKVAPGTVLKAGYDFTLPGSHPQVKVNVVGANVRFVANCTNGSSGGAFTVNAPDSETTVPPGNSAWYPSGDQKSPSVFQGSIVVPNVCNGGIVRLNLGGTFTAGWGSSDGKTKVNVRWHYSANGSAGGWSGTKSVIPTLLG